MPTRRIFFLFSFLFYEIERRGNFRRGGERGEEGRILRDPRFRFATVKTRSYNFQCSCDVSACRYFSGQVISSFSFFFPLSLFLFVAREHQRVVIVIGTEIFFSLHARSFFPRIYNGVYTRLLEEQKSFREIDIWRETARRNIGEYLWRTIVNSTKRGNSMNSIYRTE